MNKEYEIVIIGAGPAGVSAGIYALRAGMKPLIIDSGKSTLKKAKKIQNYYGFESVSGEELIKKGVNQFKKLGGNVMQAEVLKIVKNYETNLFTIKTAINEFVTKVVILAMGSPEKKRIEGLEGCENVSYCAICDGFFYKNKTIAVIGEGDFALSECEELEKIASKIYLFTNGKKITKQLPNKVIVKEQNIAEYVGGQLINGIILEGGEKINVDGVFVAQGNLSALELAKQLGVLEQNNFIVVDKQFMTNVAGVFAAGDMIGGLLQVCKAVSDGSQAGLEAVRYLKIMEYNLNNKA